MNFMSQVFMPQVFMPQVMSYYVWAVVEHPGKTKLAVSGLENPLL
jgi:hypothetical protein